MHANLTAVPMPSTTRLPTEHREFEVSAEVRFPLHSTLNEVTNRTKLRKRLFTEPVTLPCS